MYSGTIRNLNWKSFIILKSLAGGHLGGEAREQLIQAGEDLTQNQDPGASALWGPGWLTQTEGVGDFCCI